MQHEYFINIRSKISEQIAVPIYLQLYEKFKRDIRSGTLPAGYSFPPERDLATVLGLARPTIRQAFGELARKRLIRRSHGVGTFVEDSGNWRLDHKKINVGILLWNREPGGYTRILATQIFTHCLDFGFGTETLFFDPDGTPPAKLLEEKRLDGIVALGTAQDAHHQVLAQILAPKVLMEVRVPQPGLDHVAIDSFRGVYDGVMELARLGHRQIHFIGGLLRHPGAEGKTRFKMAPDLEYRLRAYRKALEDSGIEFQRDWYAELPFDYEAVEEWVRQGLNAGNEPTAIVAFDDLMASLLKEALEAAGLSVPSDVSLLGFGNIEALAQSGELATAVIDWDAMARLAVRRLHERITQNPVAGVTLEVGTVFKPGRSIATPRKPRASSRPTVQDTAPSRKGTGRQAAGSGK